MVGCVILSLFFLMSLCDKYPSWWASRPPWRVPSPCWSSSCPVSSRSKIWRQQQCHHCQCHLWMPPANEDCFPIDFLAPFLINPRLHLTDYLCTVESRWMTRCIMRKCYISMMQIVENRDNEYFRNTLVMLCVFIESKWTNLWKLSLSSLQVLQRKVDCAWETSSCGRGATGGWRNQSPWTFASDPCSALY